MGRNRLINLKFYRSNNQARQYGKISKKYDNVYVAFQEGFTSSIPTKMCVTQTQVNTTTLVIIESIFDLNKYVSTYN